MLLLIRLKLMETAAYNRGHLFRVSVRKNRGPQTKPQALVITRNKAKYQFTLYLEVGEQRALFEQGDICV